MGLLFLGMHLMQPVQFSANTQKKGTSRLIAASKTMEKWECAAPFRTKLFLQLHGYILPETFCQNQNQLAIQSISG